jgi:hypothetical protein
LRDFPSADALYPLRLALGRSDLSPDYKARLGAAFYLTKRHNANGTQLRLFRTSQLLDVLHTKAVLALKVTIPEPTPRNVDAPNPTPPAR